MIGGSMMMLKVCQKSVGRAPCSCTRQFKAFNDDDNNRFLLLSFFQDATTITKSQQDCEMDELKSKFMKHRQILTANCEQAEDEVKRLDEIFHETVNQVLQVRGLLGQFCQLSTWLKVNLTHCLTT